MSTPKLLYPTERRIYHPELTRCPACGRPTQLLNYLAWDKTVQTLSGPLSLAVSPADRPCVSVRRRAPCPPSGC